MMQSSGAGIINHTQFRRKLEEVMGEARTAEFYEHWLASHMTRADVDSMKAWGFNAIRPALHYKWFTLPVEEEVWGEDPWDEKLLTGEQVGGEQVGGELLSGEQVTEEQVAGENTTMEHTRMAPTTMEHTWIDTGFDMLDQLMDWAAANEMYVMLDMHGAPGGQGKNASINDYDETLPSLFESEANKAKLEALWVKLAERYKDNPWFGGYDLINEPNWQLGGTGNPNGCGSENNDELWDLHLRLTKAVRAVDPHNIIYISGNCWGNNYSSFEDHPLNSYDEQTVITFHKYWNVNTQESIQWAVDMRETYNRPLWMSESGENSNLWFADAIHLFESNNIGWSWWPVKKSRLNNVFRVTTPDSYRRLIDSWEDGNPLGADETFRAVMDYSEAHLHENTTVAPDVIYALIHNEDPEATRPFRAHTTGEWIRFVDYDLGRDGFAYHDKLSQDIHDEDGQWKVWNMGRQYRNDGVDIGRWDRVDAGALWPGQAGQAGQPRLPGDDASYYVGWTEAGEWLQYTMQNPEGGLYNLEIQTNGEAGKLRIEINGETVVEELSLSAEGATTIELPEGEIRVRFTILEGNPNLHAFRWVD